MGSPDAQEYIVSIVRELGGELSQSTASIGTTKSTPPITTPAWAFPPTAPASLSPFRFRPLSRKDRFCRHARRDRSAYGNYRRRYKNELIARCQAEIQSIKTNPRQPLRHSSSTMAYGGPPGNCAFRPKRLNLLFGLADDAAKWLGGCGDTHEL